MAAHCCDTMRRNVESVCEQHPDRHECPDALIDFWPASQTYGLLIHDGGSSVIVISYCPWCGTRLPEREG